MVGNNTQEKLNDEHVSPTPKLSPTERNLRQKREDANKKSSETPEKRQSAHSKTDITTEDAPHIPPKKDILVASAVNSAKKLPNPNPEGTVGSIPLEKVHPKDLRKVPSRKPNKFDTSITSPGILDDLNPREKAELEEKINGEDAAGLFPWRLIGAFFPSGKGSPKTMDVKIVKAYILENFYNDWYNNCAIIVGTCFTSWLFAYWGFSWWSLGFIFLGTASVYNAEFRRFNRNIRDDLKRTTVQETISGKVETTLWLNSFLSKFWVIYMPVLSSQVKEAVNPILASVVPGYGIDALSLEEFTLGSKAPAIRGIKSYTKTGKNSLEMDWSFAFTPNDESDMTQIEVEEKVNPKIALGVTLGKSIVSKTLSVLVEDINVAGKMRVRLEFGKIFPNIKIVSIQLLEPPLMDFVLKPLGGDTLGIDVMSFLPGLKSFVKSMVNSNVGPMLYAPNHMDINVEEIMAAQSNDAIGVLAVTLKSAEGLKGSDFITNTVDPYIVLKTEKTPNNEIKDIRSSIKSDIKDPRWNETKYLLLPTLNQKLTFSCFDFNDVRKDTLIGDIEIDLGSLLSEPNQENQTAEFMVGDKPKGLLHYSLRWVPVIEPKSEEKKPDNQAEEISDADEGEEAGDSDVGIMKFNLQKVKYLDTSTSVTGNLSPSAKLYIDGQLKKSYRALRRINEPSWNEETEILIGSKSTSKITIKIFDERIGGSEVLCEYSSNVEDLLDTFGLGQESVKGSPQGEIYFTSLWKPLATSEKFVSTTATTGPIGCIKIDVVKAKVTSNLSGLGDIDPYFSVQLNRHTKYKSKYYSNCVEPVFHEAAYIPVTSENQHITVSLIDYQSVGSDRPIGSVQLPVSSYVKKNKETGEYEDNSKTAAPTIFSLKNKKNDQTDDTMSMAVSFIPTMSVYSPDEIKDVEKLEADLKRKREDFEAEQAELKLKMEQEPDKWEEVTVKDPFEDDVKKLHRKNKLTLEQIIARNSGILSLDILGGRLAKESVFLEVLADDVSYPMFVLRGKGNKVNPERDSLFIRDLKHSKLHFRLSRKNVAKDPDDVISTDSFGTLDLLNSSYGNPKEITFSGSSLKFKMFFEPSQCELSSSESIENTGYLKLKFISADNLMSADRNGKSDPFVVAYVDRKKEYKTQIIKKTLSPVWNETAKIPIPARDRNQLILNVFDWDRAGDNDDLGAVKIDLTELEPEKTYDWNLQLSTQGTIKLQGKFLPEYIRPTVEISQGKLSDKPMKAIGTVGGTGLGAAKQVSGAAMGIAGAGLGVATGGLQKGGRLFGIGSDKNKKSRKSTESSPRIRNSLEYDTSVPNNSYTPRPSVEPASSNAEERASTKSNNLSRNTSSNMSNVGGKKSRASSFARTLAPNGTYNGNVNILSSEKLGKNIQIIISLTQAGRMKHLYKTRVQKANDNGTNVFNEACAFKASPEATLVIGAVAHHKLSKDKSLGIAQVNLGDPQIQKDENLALKLNDGHVIIKLDYAKEALENIPDVPQIPEQYQQ
ncbi:Tcb3p NDAI_0D03130 [Naumovozyma dairenensis CBS 421]|uniref:Tricalbin n=1 Tax=Naumovozyma dairenensis (strain ATCC 10597 / BCRC 20456 / CBS 421 / NBRC 0211 / NRRL Y-12639) TaxID=1071378 RepID=G0WA16_NAUDC|nr:hypothetical protein NDAI_0D03130 [Naumovozyma dairenensis CBS 421]CCD24627.1 hypothetical protein NDAI_0D03130 [Naumovozyma dairenensis CBS 421]